MVEIGNFTLDTLQLYFSWDDDLYTELKSKGFGTGDFKVLPLIYTDNTEVTIGQRERRRKFVIRPELFGETYESLGWKRTDRKSEPIIPAEKPLLNVSVILSKEPMVRFTIIPTVNGKEEYHLEYSAMSAFGKMYSNWVGLYLSPPNFKEIISKVVDILKIDKVGISDIEILTEKRQNQREEMDYAVLPVLFYKFSPAGFKYCLDFFEYNGVKGKEIPCLIFDSRNPECLKVMSPLIKLGIVHTKVAHGFDERPPQAVMKISQNKVTKSKRGKQAKVKGILKYEKNRENYILVDAQKLVSSGSKLLGYFKEKHKGVRV